MRLKPVALVFLAVFLVGCPRNSVYHTAVTIEHDARSIVETFQKAEIAEFQAGRISSDEHKLLEAGIGKVGQAGLTLTMALQQGSPQANVQTDLNVLLQAVADLNSTGVLGVKNDKSKAILDASIKALQAVLANLGNALALPQTVTGYRLTLETV